MGYKRIIRKIAKFILASQPDAFVQVNVGQIQSGSILKDKKIVITGGGSGLGFAMAKKFISEGAQIVISGRNADKLNAAVEKLGNSNCCLVFMDFYLSILQCSRNWAFQLMEFVHVQRFETIGKSLQKQFKNFLLSILQ